MGTEIWCYSREMGSDHGEVVRRVMSVELDGLALSSDGLPQLVLHLASDSSQPLFQLPHRPWLQSQLPQQQTPQVASPPPPTQVHPSPPH